MRNKSRENGLLMVVDQRVREQIIKYLMDKRIVNVN